MSKDNKPAGRHPLLNADTISSIMKEREERSIQQAITQEEVKDYSAALNRIFSSNDGQLLLKKMLRFSNLLSFDNRIDGVKLVEDKGKQKVILELILPYLRKEYIAQAIIE